MKRTCTKCLQIKNEDEFAVCSSVKDKRQPKCKACNKLYREETKGHLKEIRKACYQDNKDSIKSAVNDYRLTHVDEIKKNKRKFYKNTIVKRMLYEAKRRAIKFNLPFDINEDDLAIPEVCPVLGIKLEISKNKPGAGSPSLDRIIPELGYVKSNVCVISHRANRIKADAPLGELEKLYNYMRTNCQN